MGQHGVGGGNGKRKGVGATARGRVKATGRGGERSNREGE
jgi:hypothetical protein